MKKSRLLMGAVCAFACAVLSTHISAALVVPTGLNPGDTYHVIFVTSTSTNATSADIATYDAFVQSAADAAGIGSTIGVDWLALGSAGSVQAIDHLFPLFTDSTAPVYNQNGELVANNFGDLWIDELVNPIGYNESAILHWAFAWTGTLANGNGNPSGFLGNASGDVTFGDSGVTGKEASIFDSWLDTTLTSNATEQKPMYAVSEQLVVPGVPLPAAVWLFGSGLLGLVGMARRKKA